MSKQKIAVAALVILLLLAVSFFTIHTLKQQAAAAVEDFLAAARKGDTEGAMALLSLPGEQEVTLLEAFATNYIKPGALGEVRLASLRSAAATITIDIMGSLEETELILERTDAGWQIKDFPQIHVVQSAFLEGIAEGREGGYLYTLFHPHQGDSFYSQIFFEAQVGTVVDAVAVQGILAYLQELPSKPLEKILAHKESSLEDLREGHVGLSRNLIIYDSSKTGVSLASSRDLIPGRKNLTAFMREHEAAALILQAPYVPDRIRVLLNTSGFQGTRHSEVQITSQMAFSLADHLAEEELALSAGETLTLKPGNGGVTALLPDGREELLSGRVHLTGSGRLEVASLERGPAANPFAPSYRGNLEVAWDEGSLLVVNELPLEEYLYSVIPSEMPLSFGLEPLKAQAVAARSYAAASIFSSRFRDKGAHVDDSVNSQVYNNVPEVPLAVKAVQETTGLVGYFGTNIIDARFFSTSAGYTANFHEVWHNPDTLAFPATPIRYLTSKSQLASMDFNISNEDRIRDFLDRSDLDAYDSVSPFFRWQVTMTREELEASMEANLQERFAAQPDFILSRQGSQYISRDIPPDPLGQLTNIRVEERGEGGNIMSLEITGEKGSYLIRKEYNIRFLLRPRQYLPGGDDILIERHDGSTLKNYPLLPSAFIYFQLNRNSSGDIVSVTIRGGGNGHGVGMSQYGAYGMSQRGYDFREILSHYYPQTELWSIYARQ